MLFHSLRTNVLRSLHNNTQQPVIYLLEGKSDVAPVVLIWEKTAAAGLTLSLAPLPQNNTLAYRTQLHNECVENLSTLLRVLLTPGQDFSRQAVRRLALNGQRGIRSVIYKLQAVCKHTSFFL